MMVAKSEILALVNEFPDKVDPEEVMYRLYLKQKIANSEQDIRDGNLIDHEDAVREMNRWFK